MSIFDQIDRRFRTKPTLALEAFEEGQECPRAACRGRLAARRGVGCYCHGNSEPCPDEKAYLACDACDWDETGVGR